MRRGGGFGTLGPQCPDDGGRKIESFAAQHRSIINFMPTEERVYFVRDSTAVTSIA
jgi:hypothetical protein